MWALEALFRRFCKRLLISVDISRATILRNVELQRFINSKERNAFLGPLPARTLLQVVEEATMAALGRFFTSYYDQSRHTFGLAAALTEYRALERAIRPARTRYMPGYQRLPRAPVRAIGAHMVAN